MNVGHQTIYPRKNFQPSRPSRIRNTRCLLCVFTILHELQLNIRAKLCQDYAAATTLPLGTLTLLLRFILYPLSRYCCQTFLFGHPGQPIS